MLTKNIIKFRCILGKKSR